MQNNTDKPVIIDLVAVLKGNLKSIQRRRAQVAKLGRDKPVTFDALNRWNFKPRGDR